MRRDDRRRYAAPAGFLLAATVAVVLIHSGIENGGSSPRTTTAVKRPAKQVETTQTKNKRPPRIAAAQRFWTVQAGDTFGVISSKSGVPVATIEQLNPKVKSTSLFIGEKLRIK